MTSSSSNSDPIREPRDLLPEIVGKRNADYYLARFDELEQCGTFKPSWNWAAFFFGYWWLLYRRMYLFSFVGALGVVLLAIWAGASSPIDNLIVPQSRIYRLIFGEEFIYVADLIYAALAHVAFPLAANYLYYRYAMGRAERLLQQRADADDPAVAEEPKTPASPFRFVGAIVLVLVVGGGIGANMAMFADGKSRQKHMERESPALIAALNAFKESNGAYPEKLEQLVPDYLDSLPSCSPKGTNPIAYQRRISGGYNLHCYTYWTNKRTYDSASGKWLSWADNPPPELRSP